MRKLIVLFLGLLFCLTAFSTVIPDFSTQNLSGKMTTFSFSEDEKPLVAIFLSESCPCTKQGVDYLNKLFQAFSDFRFAGFHSKRGVDLEKTKEYQKRDNFLFPIFPDGHLKIADIFGAVKTPHTYIVGKKGEVLYAGGICNSRNPQKASRLYLENALLAIRSGKKPERKNTKTLGCYIVR